jgi:hypothetical protein
MITMSKPGKVRRIPHNIQLGPNQAPLPRQPVDPGAPADMTVEERENYKKLRDAQDKKAQSLPLPPKKKR